jgi:hypothetical protein
VEGEVRHYIRIDVAQRITGPALWRAIRIGHTRVAAEVNSTFTARSALKSLYRWAGSLRRPSRIRSR